VLDCAIARGCPVPDERLMPRLADEPAGGHAAAPGPATAACHDLLELLAGVADGRPGQGRDHPVAAVLALAAGAVVAGSRSFTAIAGWAADMPPGELRDLYQRSGAARPDAGPPSKCTIWRVVTGADAAALDAVIGAWLMERAAADGDLAGASRGDDGSGTPLVPIRVDGKTVRGARNADGSQVHLLAALAGQQGVVAGQVEVGAKTNEIPMIIPLLDGLDLDRAVVTADALHCQRATADYVHGRGADFALPVKDNQPGLFDALDALPWRDIPVTHAATDRGHGRITTRTIQVLDAPPDLPFPHVSQAYLIERHVTALDGAPISDVAALGITSLDTTCASPETIASLVRGQWAIESCTGSATPSTVKTTPPSAPDPGPGPWPRSGTSPSEPCTRPGGTTPPKPPAGPAGTSTGPLPSSDSPHDLETAVGARSREPQR
jgi:predicted transposase YbfD/YdcC